MKSIAVFYLAAALLVSTCASAGTIRTVALTGQAAPGGGTFGAPSTSLPVGTLAPAISAAGDIAFGGVTQLRSTLGGIWREVDGEVQSVARRGGPSPVPARAYTELGRPLLTPGGQLAFPAATSNSGFLTGLLVRETSTGFVGAAGNEFAISNFLNVAFNDNDHMAFITSGTPRDPIPWRLFDFMDGVPTLRAAWAGFLPVPHSSYSWTSLNSAQVNDQGQLAFGSELLRDQGLAGWAIAAGDPQNLRMAAMPNMPLPSVAAGITLQSAIRPILTRSGDVGFVAYLAGTGVNSFNDLAAMAEIDGTLQTVAREWDLAPGIPGGRFTQEPINFMINDNHDVLLTSSVFGPDVRSNNNTGLWAGQWNDLSLVARGGDQAPGTATGITFGSFMATGLNASLNARGQVALSINLQGAGVDSSNDQGLFATNAQGVLQLIAREGDRLEVAPGIFKTIREIGFQFGSNNENGISSGLNDRGQIAFAATFTDSTFGIFVTDAVSIPEPSAVIVLVLASSAPLLVHRRVRGR